jgi:N-acetyl-beta-hexosaminidase
MNNEKKWYLNGKRGAYWVNLLSNRSDMSEAIVNKVASADKLIWKRSSKEDGYSTKIFFL